MLLMIIFGVFIGSDARSGNAYLPVVGPPALRFETLSAVNVASSAKIFTPGMVKNDTVEFSGIESSANPTNAAVTVATSMVATNSSGSVSSPTIFMPAAIDNSVVTLQMLTDYLKPMTRGSVFVPINIGFIPPTPNVVQPSRAIYKSE